MSAPFPASSRPASESRSGARATVVVGLVAGSAAAFLGLAVCAAVGLVGWYLSDSGSHGDPSAGMAAGVRGWLVAHGSGVTVGDVSLTLLPLGVTLALAWLVWHAALRLGELVWHHGPDEARRGDGERDFTLPLATLGFAVGYLALALLALWGTGGGWGARSAPVVQWSLLMTVLLVGPGVALGAGRAQAWIEAAPVVLRDAFGGAGRILVAWTAVSAALFVVCLALGLGDARSTLDRLGTTGAESFLLVLACLVLVPHAVLFSSSFLLGPGFSVGAGTAVAPSGVLLGPLPLLPILGALPDEGEVPSFWAAHLVVPVLVALWVVCRRTARVGLVRWDASLGAGAGAGVLAAAFVALLTSLAGGAAGPGRLSEIGAPAGEVFVAALTPFVLGGLLGAAIGTWWARRRGVPVVDAPDEAAAQETPATADTDLDLDRTAEHADVDRTAEHVVRPAPTAPAGAAGVVAAAAAGASAGASAGAAASPTEETTPADVEETVAVEVGSLEVGADQADAEMIEPEQIEPEEIEPGPSEGNEETAVVVLGEVLEVVDDSDADADADAGAGADEPADPEADEPAEPGADEQADGGPAQR